MKATLSLDWRPFRPDDETERNYVLSSWKRSYGESPELKHLTRAAYFGMYGPVVERLLDASTIAIAVDEDLPDTIIGFMAVEDGLLHYVHVKPRFRRMGVATWMLRELREMPITYTHHPSRIALRLCGPSWTFDDSRRFEKVAA